LLVQVKNKNEKKFVMLVIPGDKRFDKNKVKDALQIKELRFATEEEVATVTGGVLIGGVPPFGNLFGVDVIADPELLENEKIIFNAGDRRFSIAMYSKDYARVVKPRVAQII
jgi:Ala-tRNA(Pro) deacylase